MARSFTPTQTARIRRGIMAAGRLLFARQGLRKTSLQELTRSAGIAKSSFYRFFDSKERLYLDLLAEDGPATEARVKAALAESPGGRNGVAALIRSVIRELERNGLTQRMLSHPEELAALAEAATPEDRAAGDRSGQAVIAPYLREGQEAGQIVAGDPELMARAIAAITLLTLHRDDIGEASYDAVMETITDLIARGLATSP